MKFSAFPSRVEVTKCRYKGFEVGIFQITPVVYEVIALLTLFLTNEISQHINIRKVPREVLKTSSFALGYQHFPRDLANVYEWKIKFDPSMH